MMVVDKKLLKRKKTLYSYIRLYWSGFGKTTILHIIALLGLSVSFKYYDLNSHSRIKLKSILRSFTKNVVNSNKQRYSRIKRLVRLRLVRGNRLMRNLPVRGQGTHTNAKTRRHWNVK